MFLIVNTSYANKDFVKAVKKGDNEAVSTFLKDGSDPNKLIKDKFSLLYYAILADQTEVAYLLLQAGANPNQIVRNKPPLWWAVEMDNERLIRYLLEYGADVNYQDSKQSTALIKAVKEAKFQITMILIERGANPLLKDQKGKVAVDYISYLEDKYAIKSYMNSIHHQLKNSLDSEDYTDGPYLFWESPEEAFLTYFNRLGKERRVVRSEKTVKFNGNAKWVKGIAPDHNSYYVRGDYSAKGSTFTSDAPVFAIGDIHGNLVGLKRLLNNNKIINDKDEWTFGKGSLVVLGDFFDRGHQVTETVWFLHDLQVKAESNGGMVHVLLGNHELMTMEGDHRYLNPRYIYVSQYMHKYHYLFYDESSEMGRWLRSLNSAIKINNVLYTHAGISPQFDTLNYPLDTINEHVRMYIDGKIIRKLGSKINMIVDGNGPFWYRGYMDPWHLAEEITPGFIDSLLMKNEVDHLVIGHNEQRKIVRTYNGVLLSIDVKMGENGKNAQGLLIQNGRMYRCFVDGRKEELLEDDPIPIRKN